MSSSEFKCPLENCSRSFKRRDRLDIHMRTHTGERPFVCLVPGCSSSYTRSQHLSRHMNRVHLANNNIVESKVRCDLCQTDFMNMDCLKRHTQRFHTINDNVKVYRCSEDGCNDVFRKKAQLIVHREKDHAHDLSSAYRCHKCPHEGCEKSFLFPTVLRRHMKVHQGYKCDVDGCSEVLESWTKLRSHKATNHAPDLVCRTCQAVFTLKQNLVQHLKTHYAEKEHFVCPEDGCERIFLYKKNLRQHIRAYHKGEIVFFRRKKQPDEINQHKSHIPRKKSLAARLSGIDDRLRKNETEPLDLTLYKKAHQDSNDGFVVSLQHPQSTSEVDDLSDYPLVNVSAAEDVTTSTHPVTFFQLKCNPFSPQTSESSSEKELSLEDREIDNLLKDTVKESSLLDEGKKELQVEDSGEEIFMEKDSVKGDTLLKDTEEKSLLKEKEKLDYVPKDIERAIVLLKDVPLSSKES